jgi:hypothetical protein
MFVDSFLGDVNSSSQEQKVRVTSFLGAKNSCFVSCYGELVIVFSIPMICYLRCVFLTEHQQQQDLIVTQSHEETDSKTLLKKTSSW